MKINIANKETELEWVVGLSKWFEVEMVEEDEMHLKFKKDSFTVEDVKELMMTIWELYPDEFDEMEDGTLRLWWD